MSRRLLIRLAIAAVVLVVVVAGGLTALIVSTSAPELPPPPLPTATAQPAAAPALQVQALVASGQDSLARASLDYAGDTQNPTQIHSAMPACGAHGRWSLIVNPQDVVGYPYAAMPAASDWARAARAAGTAQSICPAPVALTWYGHDPQRPASDRWTATLPASLAGAIDISALRRYALRHARQM